MCFLNLLPTCDSTATLLLTRSVVVIATAAESALHNILHIDLVKGCPMANKESEDCDL